MDEAFELGGQYQKYHHGTQHQQKHRRTARLLEVPGWSRHVGLYFFRQNGIGGILQVGQRFAQRVAIGEVRFDGDGAYSVEAVERTGTGKVGQRDQTGQWNKFARARRADLNVIQRAGAVLAAAVAFHDDVVLFAVVHVTGHVTAPQQHFQRAANLGHGHT